MPISDIILIVIALVPAIILLIYINAMDKVEKEPFLLIAALVILGVLIGTPAGYLNDFFNNFLLNNVFANACTIDYDVNTIFWNGRLVYSTYRIIKYLLVGIVEESLKWLVLIILTKRNRNFNCLFDGMVYSVAVSLGFAAGENVLYCLNYGFRTAIMRAFTSVPCHMFFAVIMGYFYCLAHASDNAAVIENRFHYQGIIPYIHLEPISGTPYYCKSLIIPVIVHGVYDIMVTSPYTLIYILSYALIIGLYIFGFTKVKQMSCVDTTDDRVALTLIIAKYPEIDLYQQQ